MRLDREGRRTLAQFLNGMAVALIAALVLAPVASGTAKLELMWAGLVGASICHALALYAGRRSR